MKSFYSPITEARQGPSVTASSVPSHRDIDFVSHIGTRARIAIYEAPTAAPRVEEVEPAAVGDFIEALSARVHELARAQGSSIPYTVIREVAENFIHAEFAEPVVSILDSGRTLRFADRGPGISDKERALLPGFTTASGELKRYIRGVGSGLPIVREYLIHSGGSLAIEDNLGGGSVVTLYAGNARAAAPSEPERSPMLTGYPPSPVGEDAAQSSLLAAEGSPPTARPLLTTRQKHVLALVLESGLAGPSLVAKELKVGVSTAYRDLASLEEAGLIVADGGKRTLTQKGLSFLGDLTHRS